MENSTSTHKAEHQRKLALHYQQITNKKRGQRDGVVVTPVEIVDYQIRGVKHCLEQQNATLADPRVRILDPFGGTGIYLARLMQLSELTPDQLDDLYHNRMLMIELDPEACRIADQNLRTVFQEETGRPARKSIVHNADTFTIDNPWELLNAPQ